MTTQDYETMIDHYNIGVSNFNQIRDYLDDMSKKIKKIHVCGNCSHYDTISTCNLNNEETIKTHSCGDFVFTQR